MRNHIYVTFLIWITIGDILNPWLVFFCVIIFVVCLHLVLKENFGRCRHLLGGGMIYHVKVWGFFLLYGYNSTRALIGCCAGIMKFFLGSTALLSCEQNCVRVGENNRKMDKLQLYFNNWKKNLHTDTSLVCATKKAVARASGCGKLLRCFYCILFRNCAKAI